MSDNKMQPGEFCWNELMTPDVAAAKKFYTDLFGWTAEDQDMGDFTYTIFKQGDKGIGGMFQTPPEDKHIPPHWMSYVCVNDIDVMVEKAKSLGGSIIVPKTAAGDFGYLAVIKDPTGAYFAFWKLNPEKK